MVNTTAGLMAGKTVLATGGTGGKHQPQGVGSTQRLRLSRFIRACTEAHRQNSCGLEGEMGVSTRQLGESPWPPKRE
jgi:hypothetical protein